MFDTTSGKVLLVAVFVLALLVIAMMALVVFFYLQLYKTNKKYDAFMKGANGASLEASILAKVNDVEKIKMENKLNAERLNVACTSLVNAYQKSGLVRYDGAPEATGKQSFSLCILDDKDNGFVFTVINNNDKCNTYIKEIIRGNSYVVMSAEERQALETAERINTIL